MAAPSAANKRITTEVNKLSALATSADSSVKFILEKAQNVDPTSAASRPGNAAAASSSTTPSFVIIGKILPNVDVYKQAAFQIEIKLPQEFPFKPPEVRFLTPIYHPNVDDQGKICVDILNANEAWKPTTSLVDIVKAVVDVIDHPKIDHALNAEIGSEYTNNKAEFDRKALAMVKKHGLPRS
jgi:ubiquitin-protein ligase